MKFFSRSLLLLSLGWSLTAAAVPLVLPVKECTVLNEKTSFDLGPQKPGKFISGKVEFLFSASADAQKCRGLLLGKGGAKKVRLEVSPAAKDGMLYLLHASWNASKKNPQIGKVTICMKDGSRKTFPVRRGADIMDFTSGKGAENAVRVFSVYNGATQISLFASQFACKGEVTAVELEGSSTPWCVAALSIAPKAPLEKIFPQMRITRKHEIVRPVSSELLSKIASSEKTLVRNVIFIIGDGMGFGARELASRHLYGKPGMLQAEQLPVRTSGTTFSANRPVTDSAASGTALAGGYKTNNGMVGMAPDGKKYESIAAMVKKKGYSVGIMTTDSLVGATPSAYYAHVPKRKMAQEIVDGLAVSNFDVVIGNPSQSGFVRRTDQKDMLSLFSAQNYDLVKDLKALEQVPAEKRILGFLNWKEPADLGKATALVLKRLNRNKKGFFIMIECSWPDGGGHGNNPDQSVKGVLGTEEALVASLKFAAENPGTLIIVTADHETGGIQVIPAKGNTPVLVKYTTTSHTAAPVPVFVAGSSCRAFDRKMDNAVFAKIIADFFKVKLMQSVK